jgi:hypothetical protein
LKAHLVSTLEPIKCNVLYHYVKVNELFWERTDGHLSPLRLRPDFQKRWDAVWPVVAGLYHKRAIFGFFLGDELVWMGVTPKDLKAAADIVRKDFPGAVIWVNEAAGVLAGVGLYKLNHS